MEHKTMGSKLFGHSQDLGRAMPLIREIRPEYWEVIGRQEDLPNYAECAFLGVKLLFRHPRGDMDFNPGRIKTRVWYDSAYAAAQEFVQDCSNQPWFRYAWAILTPPGMIDDSISHGDKAWAEDFLKDCVEYFQNWGKECIVGNWPHGNSGWYVPGAQYYGVQRYSWQGEIVLEPLAWFSPDWGQLVVTEAGYTRATIEHVPAGTDTQMGWKSHGPVWSIVTYQLALARLDERLQYPDRLGAFIFQIGGNPDWDSFEILRTPMEDWFKRQHIEEVIMPEITPEELAVENALNVLWGWAQKVRGVSGYQAASEMEDAVRVLKENRPPKV